MNALLIQYLVGMQPTATTTLLNELGIESTDDKPVTTRQLQNPRKTLKAGKDLISEESAAILLKALNNPQSDLQKKAADCYFTLQSFFQVHDVVVEDDVQEDAAPWVEDDVFADLEVDTVAEPEPSEDDVFADLEVDTAAEPVEDDPFADLESDPYADILETPAVGAEPVDYDRTVMEKEEAGKALDFDELLKPDEDVDPYADIF